MGVTPARPRPRPARSPPPARAPRPAAAATILAREVAVEAVRVDDVGVAADRWPDASLRRLAHSTTRRRESRSRPFAQIDRAAPAAVVLNRSVRPGRRAVVERRRCRTATRRPPRRTSRSCRRRATGRSRRRWRCRASPGSPDRSRARDGRRACRAAIGERLAGVARHVQAEAQRVDRVLVGRIDADLTEHPAVGARVADHEVVRSAADLAPRLALVVGAIDLGGLDAAPRRSAGRMASRSPSRGGRPGS